MDKQEGISHSDNIAGAVAARWLRLGPEARENTGGFGAICMCRR